MIDPPGGDEVAVATPRPSNEDLSPEIERAVRKEPRDRVRCIRLFDSFYRCNWWAPMAGTASQNPAFDWGVATTHHVRKSLFLRATLRSGKLVIEQGSQQGAVERLADPAAPPAVTTESDGRGPVPEG